MLPILLCGVSAAAINAQLGFTPASWSDLWNTTFNNSTGIGNNIFHQMIFPNVRVLPFNKIRITLECRLSASFTLSKVYVGESSFSRENYLFEKPATQVTFNNGSASVSLSGASSIVSDEIDFEYTGASPLAITFIVTANTGYANRVIADYNQHACFSKTSGDTLPDPTNASYILNSSNSFWLVKDIDVVYNHFLTSNKILNSRQKAYVVKGGNSPITDNQINTTKHNVYVVRGP